MGHDGGERDSKMPPDIVGVDDAVFDVLANAERRFAIYYLLEHRTASVEDLADVVTGWSGAATHGMATPEDWDRVHAGLLHRHLPAMSDAGLVEYDAAAGTVRLTISSPTVVELVRWALQREGAEGGE